MEKKRKIYTHLYGDLDSLASIWFASRFLRKEGGKIIFLPFSKEKEKEEEIVFVSANWNGYELRENDLALDITAGGYGIKGDIDSQKKVHSCFFKLVNEYGDDETKNVLFVLAKAIDKHDAKDTSDQAYSVYSPPSNLDEKYPKCFDRFFSTFCYAKSGIGDKNLEDESDKKLKDFIFIYLDGFYQSRIDKLTSKKDVLENTIKVGEVAIFVRKENKNRISNRNELFNLLGFSAKVYVDGNHLGIVIKDDLVDSGMRADHPYIREVVKKVGEIDQWFSHESGFLYCWSCEKAPRNKLSKVDPYELALAFERARKEHLVEIQR